MVRRAVYPGSFDPVTNGHVDIINRGMELVDELVVAVVHNPNKKPLFTIEERKAMILESLPGRPGLRVEAFTGLLVDFLKQQKANLIVKGLRAISDFEFEFQMAMLNRNLNPKIDTIFLMTSVEYAFLSSSSVREIASLGGEVRDFVPSYVLEKLRERFG